MRTDIRYACALLATVALSGCFAEVEDESIVYQQSLPVCDGGGESCSFQGVPAVITELIPIDIVAGRAEFTIDLGDSEFLSSSEDLGPIGTLQNTVKLNSASLSNIRGTTAGANPNFDGIEEMRFRQVSAGRTCATCTPTSCQDIAIYTRGPSAASPITEIAMVGNSSINMLDFMSSGRLTLCVVARGAPPTENWRADATLDMNVKAHAGM